MKGRAAERTHFYELDEEGDDALAYVGGKPGGDNRAARRYAHLAAPPERRATAAVQRKQLAGAARSAMEAQLELDTARAIGFSMPYSGPLQLSAARHTGLTDEQVRAAASHGTVEAGARLPHFETIQRAFGAHDLSNVTAHIGGASTEACHALGAHAYTAGNRIAFAARPDLALAAHEAAHVVQQRSGVQLSSAVGHPGDEYERQADAVADAVVAGESVEAMLGAPRSSGASPAVQQVVQRQSADPVADRARNNRTELDAITTSAGGEGRAIKGVGSMAKDPQLEAWALEFETSFGVYAMSHADVKEAVEQMCSRIVDFIIAAYNINKETDTPELTKQSPELADEVGKRCGVSADKKSVAGAVSREKVLAHMRGDNIRTQMTAIINFGRPFQSMITNLINKRAEAEFINAIKRKPESPGPGTSVLAGRITAMRQDPGARLTSAPTNGAAANQNQTRGEVADRTLHQSARRGADVGLTQDEAEFMRPPDLVGPADKEGTELLWEEGARKWRINEDDEWVQAIRDLNLPLKAGPSGTTDRLMQTQALLGVSSPRMMRAAALAYLLPINAHSMAEIMVAAEDRGVPLEQGLGLKMYWKVEPFGTRSMKDHSPHEMFWRAVCEDAGERTEE